MREVCQNIFAVRSKMRILYNGNWKAVGHARRWRWANEMSLFPATTATPAPLAMIATMKLLLLRLDLPPSLFFFDAVAMVQSKMDKLLFAKRLEHGIYLAKPETTHYLEVLNYSVINPIMPPKLPEPCLD